MAVPHRKEVPEDWKYPVGSWRKAPDEYGGEWWQVWGPFSVQEPWLSQAPVATEPPADFVKGFGPRPHIRDPFYQEWRDNLAVWKGTGLPDWVTEQQLAQVRPIFAAWDMGEPFIYEGKYGWSVRFPATKEYEFQQALYNVVRTPHLCVVAFQVHLVNEGKTPAIWSPWFPPEQRPQ